MHLCAEKEKAMGLEKVSKKFWSPPGTDMNSLDNWARQRSAQAREAAKSKEETTIHVTFARDTYEPSQQRQTTRVPTLKPIPIYTTTGRVDFTT